MPLAMQQAGAYTNVGDRNMDAENAYLLRRGDWNNALALNRGDNNTSLQIAGMNTEENRRQFDTSFGEGQRRYDIDWDREQQATETANRNARNNYTASTIMNTVFLRPVYLAGWPRRYRVGPVLRVELRRRVGQNL
jgi:hypothetical protein